jgi:hypothetical protein
VRRRFGLVGGLDWARGRSRAFRGGAGSSLTSGCGDRSKHRKAPASGAGPGWGITAGCGPNDANRRKPAGPRGGVERHSRVDAAGRCKRPKAPAPDLVSGELHPTRADLPVAVAGQVLSGVLHGGGAGAFGRCARWRGCRCVRGGRGGLALAVARPSRRCPSDRPRGPIQKFHCERLPPPIHIERLRAPHIPAGTRVKRRKPPRSGSPCAHEHPPDAYLRKAPAGEGTFACFARRLARRGRWASRHRCKGGGRWRLTAQAVGRRAVARHGAGARAAVVAR